jgi:hypothetical protein
VVNAGTISRSSAVVMAFWNESSCGESEDLPKAFPLDVMIAWAASMVSRITRSAHLRCVGVSWSMAVATPIASGESPVSDAVSSVSNQ